MSSKSEFLMKLKSKLEKAKLQEGPSGAAIPHAPSPPQAPKPPVAPGNSPARQQSAQAQKPAVKAAASMPKVPKPDNIAPTKPSMGKSETYFKAKRKELTISESQLMTKCEHCGVAQFKKENDSMSYEPCACFMITKSENFVSLSKNESGYTIDFNPKADPDSVRAFLLALKAKILLTKKFGE